MAGRARKCPHLCKRVHRPRRRVPTLRRRKGRFKFRKRKVSLELRVSPEENKKSQQGDSPATNSRLPSASSVRLSFLRPFKFEFQRPGRRACAGAGGAGRGSITWRRRAGSSLEQQGLDLSPTLLLAAPPWLSRSGPTCGVRVFAPSSITKRRVGILESRRGRSLPRRGPAGSSPAAEALRGSRTLAIGDRSFAVGRGGW